MVEISVQVPETRGGKNASQTLRKKKKKNEYNMCVCVSVAVENSSEVPIN
jgi:hypothetical protein